MDTQTKNTTPSLLMRLVAFLFVLAVGFAMGYINGQNGPSPTNGIVATDASTGTTATTKQDKGTSAGSADSNASGSSGTSDSATPTDSGSTTVAPTRGPTTVEEDGWYTSKEEVALYIHTYGHLPGNFISKTKARKLGWVSRRGNLQKVCPGKSIGGSEFYNNEESLPDKEGRRWYECDINYHGGHRGAERLVYSNDGLIYYTNDHYQTFERLY